MEIEERLLVDSPGGVLARIVDALHDLVAAMAERPFALIGGVARGSSVDVRRAVLAIGGPAIGGKADALLGADVPVDLLVVTEEPPRSSFGQGRAGQRKEAGGHALRWTIDTSEVRRLRTDPMNGRGPVDLPVASASALVALKVISSTDPTRGDKAATDLQDLWLLVGGDPLGGDQALVGLTHAPPPARRFVAEELVRLFRDQPSRLLDAATGPGAPRVAQDVQDVWDAVVEPHVSALRR